MLCETDDGVSAHPSQPVLTVEPQSGASFIALRDGQVMWWTDEVEHVGTYSVHVGCYETSGQEFTILDILEFELLVEHGRFLPPGSDDDDENYCSSCSNP